VGSFFHHNLTQIVDGHTGIEHNIPIAPLYNDVVTLWGKTKTHNTPTLIVNYGGLNGEYQWYQNSEVWKKKPLLNFTPETHPRRAQSPPHDGAGRGVPEWPHPGVKILHQIAECGREHQPRRPRPAQRTGCALGTLDDSTRRHEQFASPALRHAQWCEIPGHGQGNWLAGGGKLADLIVLDKNPLENIQNTESIRYVMVNGRLFEAETLNEIGNYDKNVQNSGLNSPAVRRVAQGMSHTCHEQKCVCGH
jgi:hypothetical protein